MRGGKKGEFRDWSMDYHEWYLWTTYKMDYSKLLRYIPAKIQGLLSMFKFII